ncbi:MAG: glutamate--cysteine ligase [Candidatus Omnitrophica bacterium]|nr:glutamate--cysteine ligase [Candidatus Omnitrophota bacterium]
MSAKNNKSDTAGISQATGLVIERVRARQEAIHRWLESYEKSLTLPLYTSVDMRDSGFKMAVVDTNLFPAGFNNLCEHGLADSVKFMREAILKRTPGGKDILIIAEEHTRNTWYLENVRILEKIISEAGFNVKIATFLTDQPSFCESDACVDLKTATGQTVRIYCFKKILAAYKEGKEHYDMIIMNNDLTTGIPEILHNAGIPIYPSMQAGWHARLKSHHFSHTANLIGEFAGLLELDPWLFSCLFDAADEVNINEEKDRARMADQASTLFKKIADKYREHRIPEKPYILIKADAGTYGMGVMPVEDPADILRLNRKDRNKLYKGKSAQVIRRYLLQEGVPTIYDTGHEASEVCVYQVENNFVGGFYRSHAEKGRRDNLNAPGMVLKKMCSHLKKYGDCGAHHDISVFDVYRLLARIAAIAARREIVQLEANKK